MSKKMLVVLACCGAFLATGSQGAAAGSGGPDHEGGPIR
jgi:hypothetical protein